MTDPKLTGEPRQGWITRFAFGIYDLHVKYVLNPSNRLRYEWSLIKRSHKQQFRYNSRYRNAFSFFIFLIGTYILADLQKFSYLAPRSKLRYETQYRRLIHGNVNDTIMRGKIQPHKQEIIDRGMKRGLSAFQLLELSKITQHPQIRYHGEYLADLKQK